MLCVFTSKKKYSLFNIEEKKNQKRFIVHILFRRFPISLKAYNLKMHTM